MKIIFLDIDGVLNNVHSLRAGGPDWKGLDVQCIRQAERIVREANALTIVSSTWRRIEQIVTFQTQLPKLKIIGATPTLDYLGSLVPRPERGNEIRLWFERWTESPVERYVILDDDDDFLDEQRRFLVRTDFKTGLTKEHADKAIEILKGE